MKFLGKTFSSLFKTREKIRETFNKVLNISTLSQGDIEKYDAAGDSLLKFQLYGAYDGSTAEVFHVSLKEFDDKEVFSNPGFRIEWDALTPNNWTINAQQNVSKVLELNKEYRLSFEMKTISLIIVI